MRQLRRIWVLAVVSACDSSGAVEPPDDPVDCAGIAGTFRDVSLHSGDELRHYFLHVPPDYSCEQAWPLLIDFHGTASGTEADRVEEYYALDELTAVADAMGFIVVRPRSRSKVWNGFPIYQWDINDGDLERNTAFTYDLVEALEARYEIDAGRVYAAGFSNGTNMAAQFIDDDQPLFAGYGLIAGGVWWPLEPPSLADASFRVYASTGYRDYMGDTLERLIELLRGRGLDDDQIFVRESDAGHEVYGWHFAELLDFIDSGRRPAAGELAAGWTDAGPALGQSITELAAAPAGGVVAATALGGIWTRDTDGRWTQSLQLAARPSLTGICMLGSGQGVAVGEGAVARTTDGGVTWQTAPAVPPFSSTWFSYSYINGVACGGDRIVGAGYQTAVTSADAGQTWVEASMKLAGSYTAQGAAVASSASGTWIAVGYYDYVARSTDGASFQQAALATSRQWWTDAAPVAPSTWIVVGEAGAILRSTDDGRSFTTVSSPVTEDLYAIAFTDGARGMAVGAHGTALLTSDGGSSWTDVSTGLDAYLGDVLWLAPDRALVGGQGGGTWTFQVAAR